MDGLEFDGGMGGAVTTEPVNGMVTGIPGGATCGIPCVGPDGIVSGEPRPQADTYRNVVLDSLASAQARVTEALAHYRDQRGQAVARHAEELSGLDAHIAALEVALGAQAASPVRRAVGGFLWERIVADLRSRPGHTATLSILARALRVSSNRVATAVRQRPDTFRVTGRRGALAATLIAKDNAGQ